MTQSGTMPALRNYSAKQFSQLVARLDPNSQRELTQLLERREQYELWSQVAKPVACWEAGPLLWLTSHTFTEDHHSLAKGTEFLAPFPRDEYIRVLVDYILFEQCLDANASNVLFVLKTREMMFSWTAVGLITWMCQFLNVFWVAQSGKESKGAELVNYARILWRNQPAWMKRRNPLVVDNDLELQWKSGGRFKAIASGEDQIRMFHPHGYMQDESSFLPEAEQAFNAARPVVAQIICGSTDEVGWFSRQCKGLV
jgi:hypothetical protein